MLTFICRKSETKSVDNNEPIHEDNVEAKNPKARKNGKTDNSKELDQIKPEPSNMSAKRENRVKKKDSTPVVGKTEKAREDKIESDLKEDKKKGLTGGTEKSHGKRGDRSLYDIDERWIKNNVVYPRPTPLQVQYVQELLSLL